MNVAEPIATTLFDFDNTYARLPSRFYARQQPTPMPAPSLIRLNVPLAHELGLDPDALASASGVRALAGGEVPLGAEPLAMAYAGHQFGGFVPQLGDGRALLLGEIVDRAGVRRDVQLKGSGRTPFSRQGDGRAALGPILREHLVSEALHALGIPTTRSLACALTGETVQRERPIPGALLVRVARSHVRVGTFQYFAARRDHDAVRALADYVVARHYPEAAEQPEPYPALLDEIVARQARLTAQWMHVGFIHGVMNTDNTQIAGETIDYGPCAFLDTFHPATVFSFIDRGGRYAYANQPRAAHWNLAQLANCLIPIFDTNEERAIARAVESIDAFTEHYDRAWLEGMRAKLGLHTGSATDAELGQALLDSMTEGAADYTLTFRRLADVTFDEAVPQGAAPVRDLFDDPGPFDAWLERWRGRCALEGRPDRDRQALMRSVNPAFIPRNHRVEAAIAAALEGDFGPFETLVDVLAQPCIDQPEHRALMEPPRPEEVVHTTFCGT